MKPDGKNAPEATGKVSLDVPKTGKIPVEAGEPRGAEVSKCAESNDVGDGPDADNLELESPEEE